MLSCLTWNFVLNIKSLFELTPGPGPYGEPLELETSSEFDEIIMKIVLVCDMIGEKKY